MHGVKLRTDVYTAHRPENLPRQLVDTSRRSKGSTLRYLDAPVRDVYSRVAQYLVL